MNVTLELSDDAYARLSAQVTRRRLTIEAIITEFADGLPRCESPGRLSLVGIGDCGVNHRVVHGPTVLLPFASVEPGKSITMVRYEAERRL